MAPNRRMPVVAANPATLAARSKGGGMPMAPPMVRAPFNAGGHGGYGHGHGGAEACIGEEPPAKMPRTEDRLSDGPSLDDLQDAIEGEMDDTSDVASPLQAQVGWDPADMTLNVVPTLDGSILRPLIDGGLQYFIASARASVGVTSGRYFYEVRIVEILQPADVRRPQPPLPKQLVRLGFSTANASLVVDSEESMFFDNEGYFVTGSTRVPAARRMNRNQVFGVLLNMNQSGPNANTVSLFCEGQRLSDPQPLPEACRGKALFPHVVFRNVSLHMHFGPQPMVPFRFKCRMLQGAAKADVLVRQPSTSKDGTCEVVVPVAVPEEGGFDWLDDFLVRNPQYVELSDRKLLEWATISGLTKQKVNTAKNSNDKPDVNFGVPCLDELAMRKIISAVVPFTPRNYVVMELRANLLQAERAELMKRFNYPHFKRIAHVVVGEPPASFKQKVHDQLLKEKQEKLDKEHKVLVAEWERKRRVKTQMRLMEEKRKAAEEAKKKAEEAKSKEGEDAEKKEESGMDVDKDKDSKAADAAKQEQDVKEEGKDSEDKGAGEAKPNQAVEDFQKLTVTQLKDRLKALNLPTSGNKVELVARMKEHAEKARSDKTKDDEKKEAAKKEGKEDETEAVKEEKLEDAEDDEDKLPEAPKASLTPEEQKTWFRQQAYPDIAGPLLCSSFAQFTIPSTSEGFDEIRHAWQGPEGSLEHLQRWVRERKLTTRVEDVQPSEWFQARLDIWRDKLQLWQKKQKDYKNEARLKEGEAAKRKKAAEQKAKEQKAKADDTKDEGEKEEDKEGAPKEGESQKKGEEKDAMNVDEGAKADEAKKDADSAKAGEEKAADEDDEEEKKKKPIDDVFVVEDVVDADGQGEPLFAHFAQEDWIMMSLRYELHLLVQAFSHDVNDPDRPGMREEHLLFYFARYYRKQLNVKYFGKDTLADVILLVKDTVVFKDSYLESALEKPSEVEPEYYVKLTEEARRTRQRRIDAGDDTARIRISHGGGVQVHQGQTVPPPSRPKPGGYGPASSTWGPGSSPGGGQAWNRPRLPYAGGPNTGARGKWGAPAAPQGFWR